MSRVEHTHLVIGVCHMCSGETVNINKFEAECEFYIRVCNPCMDGMFQSLPEEDMIRIATIKKLES